MSNRDLLSLGLNQVESVEQPSNPENPESSEKKSESAESRGAAIMDKFKGLGSKMLSGLKRFGLNALGGAAIGAEAVGSGVKSGLEGARSGLEKGSAAVLDAPELVLDAAADWTNTKRDEVFAFVSDKYSAMKDSIGNGVETISAKGREARDGFKAKVESAKAWGAMMKQKGGEFALSAAAKLEYSKLAMAEKLKASAEKRLSELEANGQLRAKLGESLNA